MPEQCSIITADVQRLERLLHQVMPHREAEIRNAMAQMSMADESVEVKFRTLLQIALDCIQHGN